MRLPEWLVAVTFAPPGGGLDVLTATTGQRQRPARGVPFHLFRRQDGTLPLEDTLSVTAIERLEADEGYGKLVRLLLDRLLDARQPLGEAEVPVRVVLDVTDYARGPGLLDAGRRLRAAYGRPRLAVSTVEVAEDSLRAPRFDRGRLRVPRREVVAALVDLLDRRAMTAPSGGLAGELKRQLQTMRRLPLKGDGTDPDAPAEDLAIGLGLLAWVERQRPTAGTIVPVKVA